MPSLESPYFHHKDKGCQVIHKTFLGYQGKGSIQGLYCHTHKVDLCGQDQLEWHHGYTEEERQRKFPPRNETITGKT